MQVVFGHGPARTSEFPRGPSGSGSNRSGTGHKGDSIADDDGHEIGNIASTDDGNEICNIDSTADASESAPKMEKEYVEPWDYTSYYPTTLPLRRPYSGEPELLDEQEFGKASADFDETCINLAAELGLTDNKEGKMILFHLPHSLPLVKHAASRKGKEIIDACKPPPTRNNTSETTCSMKDLPAGFIGKMLVYKSGAVKMKLRDIIFDIFHLTRSLSTGTQRLRLQLVQLKAWNTCIIKQIHPLFIGTSSHPIFYLGKGFIQSCQILGSQSLVLLGTRLMCPLG